MIVSRENFHALVKKLSQKGLYGTDLETTGLSRKDRLFSISIADKDDGYYFNFNHTPDHLGNLAPKDFLLPWEWLEELQPVFENPDSTHFIHNAKFDLRMLAKEGLCILGAVHCTEAVERVLFNNLHDGSYNLAACAERRGMAKDETVEAYMRKYKLMEKANIPGKSEDFELWHMERVPFEVAAARGSGDAILHRAIGIMQCQKLKEKEEQCPNAVPLLPLLINERKFTKALFRMEEAGLHFDRDYTMKAWRHSEALSQAAVKKFEDMTSLPFDNKAKTFVEAFGRFGIELPKTPTGKPCTNMETLESIDNPLGDVIREIRAPQKLITTYFSSFIHYADEEDRIHANVRQGGTRTGRLSYREPNLQNLPKEDEPEDAGKPFWVRGCFTPLSSNWYLVPIDFKQQEFKMMIDYAKEHALIVLANSGMDIHEATAQLMGCSRKQAKTLNFGLLYGMGAPKLAKQLGISLKDAYELKAQYFGQFPGIKDWIDLVVATGKKRTFIWNWFGFRMDCDMEKPYKLPNGLIQGGCGQVIRRATVEVDEYICKKRLRSHMVAQVHDEILFQVHKSEVEEIQNFKRIMESVYPPRNGCILDCSVEHSTRSWAKWHQVKGLPA